MQFHYLHIWSIETFDEATKIHTLEDGQIIVENVGLVVDIKTADPLFGLMGHFFAENSLKANLQNFQNPKLTFTEVNRATKGANWLENYPFEEPPKFWQINFAGLPGIDHFALSNFHYLTVSDVALDFLRNNDVVHAESDLIDIPISEYFATPRKYFWMSGNMRRYFEDMEAKKRV